MREREIKLRDAAFAVGEGFAARAGDDGAHVGVDIVCYNGDGTYDVRRDDGSVSEDL